MLPSPTLPWIVLGLGNPPTRGGPLRANAGVMAVEGMTAGAPFQRAGVLELCNVTIIDVEVTLMKVSGFMERAGPLVAPYLHERQIPSTNLIVVYGDAETLQMGSLRIRTRGSAGGHRGIDSIIKAFSGVEVPEVSRIRIGTGLPPLASSRIDFSDAEVARLKGIFPGVARAIRLLVQGRADAAMSLYNRRDQPIDSVPGLVRPVAGQ